LVDPESVEDRLDRLNELLDQIHAGGREGYLAAEPGPKMPTDYRGVFDALGGLG
jgi:hypothetical protein